MLKTCKSFNVQKTRYYLAAYCIINNVLDWKHVDVLYCNYFYVNHHNIWIIVVRPRATVPHHVMYVCLCSMLTKIYGHNGWHKMQPIRWPIVAIYQPWLNASVRLLNCINVQRFYMIQNFKRPIHYVLVICIFYQRVSANLLKEIRFCLLSRQLKKKLVHYKL